MVFLATSSLPAPPAVGRAAARAAGAAAAAVGLDDVAVEARAGRAAEEAAGPDAAAAAAGRAGIEARADDDSVRRAKLETFMFHT